MQFNELRWSEAKGITCGKFLVAELAQMKYLEEFVDRESQLVSEIVLYFWILMVNMLDVHASCIQ